MKSSAVFAALLLFLLVAGPAQAAALAGADADAADADAAPTRIWCYDHYIQTQNPHDAVLLCVDYLVIEVVYCTVRPPTC